MRQCRSRPWGRCTFNCVHNQNIFRTFQYQFLCGSEWTLNVLEVRVLENFQFLCVIWSKMNGCFHWRRHEQSPYQYIGLYCFNCKCCVTLCDSQILLHMLEKPSSSIDHLRSSCSETPLYSRPAPVPWCQSSSKIYSCHPVSKRVCIFWVFSCRLTWEHSIGSRLGFRISFLMPRSLFFFGILQIDGIAQILRRGLPRTHRVVHHQIRGSRLRHRRLHWLWFLPSVNRHWKSRLDLSLTWRSAFRSDHKEKLLKWQEENIDTFIMLNWRRRRFHSPRVKVSMSVSWFLVSTYLIWIFGSELTLSNNQSKATLYLLDTCLIVGLLPLMIILITSSLSSKMYNWDSSWEECVLAGTESTFDNWSTSRLLHFSVSVSRDWASCFFWFFFVARMVSCPAPFLEASLNVLYVLFVERNTSITTTQRSRPSNPSISNPASNEMIWDSVELWDTDVCFLHIQPIGTNVRLPKIHKTPPEVDFESSRSSTKFWVLEYTQSSILSRVAHMTMLSVVISVMSVRNQSCQTSGASLSPFLWLLLQVCWQTIKCLVYQFVPGTSISRRFVSTLFDIFPTDSIFFEKKKRSIQGRTWNFV